MIQKELPEPHFSLAAGILLGVRAQMSRDFYEDLIETGTLYVRAASGYNVSIVMKVVIGLALIFFTRGVGLVIGLLAIAAYVVISGGSAAVIRAGVMGSLAYIAYFWGRAGEAKRLLWIASYLMLLVSPLLIVDPGFHLSVGATAGILYLEPRIRSFAESKWKLGQKGKLGKYLGENLYPTLSASIVTAPIIWLHFGRVS